MAFGSRIGELVAAIGSGMKRLDGASRYQELREFGVIHDAFLSKIR